MQGKVAMVTGGGRGIGEASARRLADFGAKVILADLDLASATAVAESLKAEGKEAAAIEFNVADFDHITEKVAAARGLRLGAGAGGERSVYRVAAPSGARGVAAACGLRRGV